jgi:hypothetical protein
VEDRIQIVLEAIEIGRQKLDEAVARIDKFSKSQKDQNEVSKKQDSILKGMVPTWAKVVAIATAAATAITLATKSQLENIDVTNKQADALGTTIEKLSALKFAFKLSQIGAEGGVQALQFLNRAIAESGDASSNAAKAFQVLKINTKGLGDRDEIDVLFEVADAFKRTEGAAAKAEVAQALFGRGSRDVVNFLNGGSAAIKENMDLAQQLGLVYSQQTGKSAETLNDQLTTLEGSFQGIVAVVLGNLLPTLNEYAAIILDVVKDKQLMIDITQNLTSIFEFLVKEAFGVVTVFRFLWDVLANQLAVAWLNFNRLVEGGIALFSNYVTTLKNVSAALIDIVRRVASFGEVFRLAFNRDFSGAATAARAALAGIAGDIGDAFKAEATGVVNAGKIVVGTAVDVAGNISAATTQTINDITATATSASSQITRVANAAQKSANVQTKTSTAAAPANTEKLQSIAALNEAQKRKEIAEQLNVELLQTEGERLQSADLLRQAAIAKELADNDKRVKSINDLQFASDEERHRLLEQAERLHQEKVLAIEKESLQTRLHIMATQLDAAKGTFSGIADAIKEFGGEGTTAYKVFATAAAVIDTARAAIAAYSSTVGIPYVGPILAPIAAGAAVAFGAAQIAKINGAFAEGGIVPGTPSLVDNRVVAVASGELILSTLATRNIMRQVGPGGVNALLSGQVPNADRFSGGYTPRSASYHFATGGLVGPVPDAGRGATSVDITLAEVTNRNDLREQMARDSALIIVDKLNRRGNRLKA